DEADVAITARLGGRRHGAGGELLAAGAFRRLGSTTRRATGANFLADLDLIAIFGAQGEVEDAAVASGFLLGTGRIARLLLECLAELEVGVAAYAPAPGKLVDFLG